MCCFSRLLLCVVFIAAMPLAAAHGHDDAVYLATYVEVMPNALDPAADLLAHYRTASRKQSGNLRFDVLREIARPNRFAILETWQDKAALEAHQAAAPAAQFRDGLKAIAAAPYDERINNGLYLGSARPDGGPDAVYVMTHVDVVPQGKDDCIAALHDMSVDTPKDAGNLEYDVFQQANRGNHFTVFEAWASRNALDAHAMAAHTRAFRDKLVPIAGALYDERFYKLLK